MTAGGDRGRRELATASGATGQGDGQSELRNRILHALPEAERGRLLPHLTRITLEPMQVIADAERALSHVYFAESAVVSVLRRMRDGTLIEAGMVGCDGMAGLPALVDVVSPSTIAAQVPGECHRMSAATLRDLLPELPTLSRLLGRYTIVFTDQLAQTIACNSLHSVEQRCTRWLLTAHDLVGSDEFHLTHETLAMLLGVRRAGVTVSALMLQRAGVIAYSRGRLTIRDRAGLEAATCECHSASRAFAEKVWREAMQAG